jgi:hypothetical protein
MSTNLIDKFKYLPDELIHNIINYTNIVVYRNGKYINRICKNDKRYNIIINISKPIQINLNTYSLRLFNNKNKKGIVLNYIIENYVKLNIIFIMFNPCNIKKSINYIFNNNNNWSMTINYSM